MQNSGKIRETFSYKSLILEKAEIKKYSLKNNYKGAFDLAIRLVFHISCIFFGYLAFIHHHYLAAVMISIPHFIAYSFLGWAGIGHELFHNSVFSGKKLNLFLFRFFSVLTWNNYKYFEITHWKHHKDTLLPDDPEGQPDRGLSKIEIFWAIIIDVPSFIRRVKVLSVNSFNRVPSALGKTLFPPDSRARKELCNAARVIILFHLFTAAVFIVLKLYWLILLINMAPFAITIFNRLLAVSQHYGTDPEGGADYFSSTRTVVLDKVFGFLYANMNYHVEHHFFPFIPYYNLPKVHLALSTKYKFPHYSSGLRNLIKELKNRGCFKA